MRYLALLLLLVLPAAAAAQDHERERRAPRPRDSQGTPRSTPAPRIGQPLLPAGWQWFGSNGRGPQIGQPLAPAGQQWFGSAGDRDAWKGRPHRPWFGRPGAGYAAYYPAYETAAAVEAEQWIAAPTTGLLRLEITPAIALQYFVDGLFIGSSSDLGFEIELIAGPRRIEIRAPGYKPLVFDMRVTEGRGVTYRGALEPQAEPEPEARPQPPGGSSRLYFIPGCYWGNSPPRPDFLPKGCDIGQLRTR